MHQLPEAATTRSEGAVSDECAQAGDADALGLVDDAAAELARSVLTVVGKTAPGGGGGEGVWTGRVVLVGGVLAGASAGGGANVLLEKLLHNLHRDLPRAQIVTPTAEPAVGAAWLIAREAAGALGRTSTCSAPER